MSHKFRRYWTAEEDDFLLEHYKSRGPEYCSRELKRDYQTTVSRAFKLKNGAKRSIERTTSQPSWFRVGQYSTLYSISQLAALDAIGVAWTDKRIDWATACELRELVKEARIDEALSQLELAKERAA